jgi:trimeric autotransporter adhesin
MKKVTGIILIFSSMLIFSCKKDSVKPTTDATQATSPTTPPSNQPNVTGSVTTSVPEAPVNGSLKLQLFKDSINNDAILIDFKPTAKPTYVPGEDAPALSGFGLVSLTSLSSDNIPLAINLMPLTSKGRTIALAVSAKTDGIYKLGLKTITSIPDNYEIWLKDGFKKDSLDLRQNPTYAFNIYKTDTTSFGRNRFKVLLREKLN